jgi:integrase
MLQSPKRRLRAPRKIRLTELTVQKAKPAAKAYLTWDTKQPGLAFRIQPSGAKAWKVIYSRHGRSRWLHLGGVAVIPLADARVMAAQAMLNVAKGGDPAADKRAERGAGTFAELAAKYVEQHAKKHNRSWPQADALVRRHVLPRWGKLRAAAITRGDVKNLMAKIDAPIAANQVLASVSAIFSWAIAEDILPANPCRLVKRNETKSRERVLADSELPRFWKALDDIDPLRAAALRSILLLGQRPGEISNMRREHIADNWWTLPGEPVPGVWPGTKNGQTHRVWLSAPAQAMLAGLDNAAGFVFRGPRGGTVHGLDGVMRRVCAKLGIERATPHDLRRTFSTTVAGLGFGRDALNRVTNHREGGIASVYDRHGYAEENKRVMETTAGRIMSLVEGRGDNGKIVNFEPR